MWVSSLTHTVTHTAKGAERDRERQAGSYNFLPGVFLPVGSVGAINFSMLFSEKYAILRTVEIRI